MNRDEAFGELGLTSESGREDIRRAYLKLLRTRKPDVDPTGFMRLREAYELLTANPGRVVEVPRERANVAVSSPPQETRGTDKRSTLDAPPSSPHPKADVEESEAEVAHAPGDPPSSTKESLSDPDEVLERLGAKNAANRYVEVIDGCTTSGSTPPFPPFAVVRLTLLLQHADKPASARRLIESYSTWLNATGSELRLLNRQSASGWVVARELAALGAQVPFEMKQPIARAALDGDLILARDAVYNVGARNPKGVTPILVALAHFAPSLNATFRPVLRASVGVKRIAETARFIFIGLFLIALVAMGKCFCAAVDPDNAAKAMQPIPQCNYRLERLMHGANSVRIQTLAQELQLLIDVPRCEAATAHLHDLESQVKDDPSVIEGCKAAVELVCAQDGGAP